MRRTFNGRAAARILLLCGTTAALTLTADRVFAGTVYNPFSGEIDYVGAAAPSGASALEAFVGAARSSPTASITADAGQFIGSVSGSTFSFTLNSGSVTLQGNANTFLAVGATTATLRTQILDVGLTTATLRTQILDVGLTTATLQTQITATALSTQTLSLAVGLTTASLQTQITATALSTQTLALAVGLTTASLQTQITATALSTQTLALAVGLTTATLQSNFPVSLSTNTVGTLDISAQTNLTASGQAVRVGDDVGVGRTDISTGTNLTASGQAVLAGDNVGVGPTSLSTGTIGKADIATQTNFAAGVVGSTVGLTSADTNPALKITQTGNIPASSSVGGAINVTNHAAGAALVIFSTAGTPTDNLVNIRVDSNTFNQNALFVDFKGGQTTSITPAVTIRSSVTAMGYALNIVGRSSATSTMQLSGEEAAVGSFKITHTSPTVNPITSDVNASAISISLAGSGTQAQGIFIDSASPGTTGKLMNVRNAGEEFFTLTNQKNETLKYGLLVGTMTSTAFNISTTSTTATGDFLVVTGTATFATPPVLPSFTVAQINLITPKFVGQVVRVSDATALQQCQSTGTVAGAWASPVAKTTACR